MAETLRALGLGFLGDAYTIYMCAIEAPVDGQLPDTTKDQNNSARIERESHRLQALTGMITRPHVYLHLVPRRW